MVDVFGVYARSPASACPGQPAREERNGVAAIFCAVAPHPEWRSVEECERKTRRDYAAFLRALADEHFPEAERIVLVQDNLNTHSPGARLPGPAHPGPPHARAEIARLARRDRNQAATAIRWQFTTADARVKLVKLHPSSQQ